MQISYVNQKKTVFKIICESEESNALPGNERFAEDPKKLVCLTFENFIDKFFH